MSTFLKSVSALPARVAQMILGLLAGLSVYAASVQVFGSGNLLTVIMLIPMSMAFAFVSTLIHEAGHAAAAAQNRWVIERFVVYPLVYSRRKKAWAIDFDMPGDGDILGWVETHPVGTGGSRKQETWILVGGGLANLLAAGACILIAPFVGYPFKGVLGGFMIFSVVDAWVNLTPWRVRGRANDGLKVWRLWRRERPRARKTKSQWNVPRKW